jgi:signal-transduction protein with cAMP-binding, CBS, and nucleotidyltransferase domain
MKIGDLPKLKDLHLITVLPEEGVMDVTRKMAKFNIGIVVVVDENGRTIGVLSERDILWCLGTMDTPIEEAIVGDLMSKRVITISPDNTMIDAIIAMNANGIRHLIVADDGRPVEMISIRDVLQAFAQEQLEANGGDDGRFAREFAEALAAAA